MQKINLSPAQILVTLGPPAQGAMKGHIFSGYYHRMSPFSNETELLFAVDLLCDSMQYPQASFQRRRFGVKSVKTVVRKAEDFVDEEMEEIIEQERATFIIHIQFRQNATWQGTITWAEKEKTQNFRSALEMLKLMEEARDDGVTETVKWDGTAAG